MEKKKFIQFARACSGEETVHTIDSMNWPMKVFGACWYDYAHDKKFLKNTYFAIKDMFEKAHQGVWSASASFSIPMTKFLKPIFLGFPMNVFDTMYGFKYVDNYINYFFTSEDGSPINKYCNTQKMLMFNPFSQANQSFHIGITFNKEIRLSMDLM